MTRQNFDAVMVQIFKHEGGYVNHASDPGGETNFGISKRSYPRVNIRGLTKASAAKIYQRDFWPKAKGDQLPDGLDLVSMDGSVNSGPKRGAKWLQKGLRVKADGVLGPQTLNAATQPLKGVEVIQRACQARMGFLRGLRTWSVFGGGWSRRVASVEAVGVSMWLKAHEVTTARDELVIHSSQAQANSKNEGKASATTAGGGVVGGTGAEAYDFEPWMIAVAVVAALLVSVVLWGRARNNKIRAEAYEAEAVALGV